MRRRSHDGFRIRPLRPATTHFSTLSGRIFCWRGGRPRLPSSNIQEFVVIEVQHLTKRYGRFTAVEDVSFRVERGEILGFLGPNGAGKSTTMRILTGYMPATEGKAIVAGFDVFEQPVEASAGPAICLRRRRSIRT